VTLAGANLAINPLRVPRHHNGPRGLPIWRLGNRRRHGGDLPHRLRRL